jgi:hypothetical protein
LPYAIVSTDVNHDGFADLVDGNGGTNSYGLFPGKGDGTFTLLGIYSAVASPWGLAAADLNGDNNADLVVGPVSSNAASAKTLQVLAGNANGTFQAPKAAMGPTTASWAVATADFDCDGKLDVAATGTNNGLGIFLGDGKLGLAFAASVAAGVATRGLAVADLNGDKLPDAVVSNDYDATVTVLLNASK